MKKIAGIIGILIISVVIYLLEANFFNWFTIAEIKPNLFIIFILFIRFICRDKNGIWNGSNNRPID